MIGSRAIKIQFLTNQQINIKLTSLLDDISGIDPIRTSRK
ncbi:hypothetical protein D1AOALGA4SA_10989 [Olavius algarvensis Delta 1 endosymbiont]|nr:hypothetical protein D1AOALGA4SA_10989 [Olavius algarvensis Delta 1 endosymbiont]